MTLDNTLLAILACPDDKGELFYIESEQVLFNPRLARTYDVRDGIPVMLVDEATALSADEAARLARIVAEQGIPPTAHGAI